MLEALHIILMRRKLRMIKRINNKVYLGSSVLIFKQIKNCLAN